jgi:hypothetical protein
LDLKIVEKWDGLTPVVIGGGDRTMWPLQDLQRLRPQNNVDSIPNNAPAQQRRRQ